MDVDMGYSQSVMYKNLGIFVKGPLLVRFTDVEKTPVVQQYP
jgi:hypothetical protein